MLLFERLIVKNFFSFGNVPQEFDFRETDIALVLGKNNDAQQMGEGESRNGVGKSSLLQALCYALYGKSIDNSIKVVNLVNKTNAKNMEVELHFSKDGKYYHVMRGRSPQYFHFYEVTEDGDKITDDTRGESDSTQEELDEVLKMSQALFEQIVVQNTTVEPFLKLTATKQRDMIEELLGLTELTEKAQRLKDMAKESKRMAEQEKLRNDTISVSNDKILSTISFMKESSTDFENKKANTISTIQKNLSDFDGIDLDDMMKQAVELERILNHNKDREKLVAHIVLLSNKKDAYDTIIKNKKNTIMQNINELKVLDIDAELELHAFNASVLEVDKQRQIALNGLTVLKGDLQKLNSNALLIKSRMQSLQRSLVEMQESTCPTCKQEVPCSDDHLKRIASTTDDIARLQDELDTNAVLVKEKEEEYASHVVPDVPEKKSTYYSSESEAKLHQHKLNELQASYDAPEENPYTKDIDEALLVLDQCEELPVPEIQYSTSEVQTLVFQKTNLEDSLVKAQNDVNPYTVQIELLSSTGLQEVNYDEYNRLMKNADHEEFLSKLLMNKDSHVRKCIIDQSIPFLNSRLDTYITASGSQHEVQFQSDLSVSILHMGRDYDFSQLSRGERFRVIIALNNAFRDTYESLHQPINLIIVDELIDNGLDSSGVECAWRTLYDMAVCRNKNVLVVSHREELLSKAENIIMVERTDGFSSVQRMKSYDM